MIGKKLLIFMLFGLMVFVGALAMMLLLDQKFPLIDKNASLEDKAGSTTDDGVDKPVRSSKVSNMVTRMYYSRVTDEGKETLSSKNKLLNKIKFTKLVNEVNRLKDSYELKHVGLKEREKRLDTLKADLVSEKKKISLLKQDLLNELDLLDNTKKSVEASLSVMNKDEATNMKLLASIYEGMKPKQAASIIAQMDSHTAVKLLKLMDQRNSAKILQDVEPEMAVKLSERIRGNKLD